ncbi:MAG: 16S rRNA (guanine(527)-N(7))-methyltransferase RsmG [Clostridia bacterium]|nr:16S rRNA (guanine(527)-N(7))-methyltransferase RsmG [Clostridia bacterium]
MSFAENLREQTALIGVELDDTAVGRFEIYYRMLVDYNTRMNLTAITEEQEVIVKHFCDSLYILSKFRIKEGASVIDVGTGAGFPGLPLLIARPDIKLTLLDGLGKRLQFLSDVLGELGLSAEIVHSRAEESAVDTDYRQKFDIATSRAVARLNVLCEYCLPYVKKGGAFIAMKGPAATEELSESKKAISILGGKLKESREYTLSDESSRTLVVVDKVATTPDRYPRHNSQIKKKPL